jgi:hypothetical protein
MYFIKHIENSNSKKRKSIDDSEEILSENNIQNSELNVNELLQKIQDLEKQLQHSKHINNMLVKKNKRLKKQISNNK